MGSHEGQEVSATHNNFMDINPYQMQQAAAKKQEPKHNFTMDDRANDFK
jgi:hypothetical protein